MACDLSLHVMVEPCGEGAWNMARDEACLQVIRAGVPRGYLRLYSWARPTLSLGYAQPAGRAVDQEYCRAHGIDVVRRVTGGRAVLHHREYTYAVALPYDALPDGGTLARCYGLLAQALAGALVSLGIPAERGAGGKRVGKGQVCFASTARDEIRLHGKKLVGSAQRRGAAGFLQHGSILLYPDTALHCAAMGQPEPSEALWSGLAEAMEKVPALGELCEALSAQLQKLLGARITRAACEAVEAATADLRAKHASSDWILRVP